MKRIYNPNNLSEAKLWLLGLNYIQAERDDGVYYDTLPKSENNTEKIEKRLKTLKNSWSITNKEEFLKEIEKYISLEMVKKYNNMIQFFSTLSITVQDNYINRFDSDSKDYIRYKLIKAYYNKLPEAGVSAFDYSRYIFLCRSAVMVNFIEEDEVWQLMIKAGKAVQEAYSSWREYVLAYEVGKQLFQAKGLINEPVAEEIKYIRQMILDEYSPMQKLDWNIKLE